MLKKVRIEDLELFEVGFGRCWHFNGLISILEHALDNHVFCELEITVLLGFMLFLELLEETISNSRRIRKPVATSPGEG